MKILYFLYQVFIAMPILLIATVITCASIITGTYIGKNQYIIDVLSDKINHIS